MARRRDRNIDSSTIRRSTASALLAALIAQGCGHTTSEAPSRVEAPAPHLRRGDEHGSAHDARRDAHVDPMSDPAAGDEVSLGGILSYADRHSPLLAVARSTRSRAAAARTAASPRLPANPELTVAAGPRFGRTATGLDIDLSLKQTLEIAGERGLRLEAAERLADLTDAEIEALRWQVHCDVHAAFHAALVEQERSQLAGRVMTFQEEVLRVVERQIAAGEAAALTLRLAQAEVAQAHQVQVAAQQAFFASRLRLAQLSGWPVASPPTPGGQVDAPRPPPPLAELLRLAFERVPSLRADAARVEEAAARASAADREAWVRPSIGVQYRREGNSPDEGATDIVMGVLSLPIPSFDSNQGPRASAHADAAVARAGLAASRQLLEGQVAEAWSGLGAASQRALAYGTEILPRFEENLTLLRRAFELGEIDILSLSTGRERFLRIQSDALAAQLDYFTALAGLERVVGVDLWHDDHHAEKPQ